MKLLDGKALANQKKQELTKKVENQFSKTGKKPQLAIILVGDDKDSATYVNLKKRRCEEIGIICNIIHCKSDISQEEIEQEIRRLNQDKETTGILVQLPLPQGIDSDKIIESIDYKKDVDGLTSKNIGYLVSGTPYIPPCTPKGILELLKANDIILEGKRALVIGRSNLVGKPTSQLLLQENCTVTLAHSKTQNLEELVQKADILVLAMGHPGVVKPAMLKKGVVVIDVAMNRVNEHLEGDIYNERNLPELKEKCEAITPVPGGIGPMTIISLMENIVENV